MKSIQMILYSYFLILGKVIGNETTKSYIENIDFCSASNKLKVYNGPKIDLNSLKGKNKKNSSELIIEQITNIPENENNYVVESEDEDKTEIKPIVKETKKKPTLKYADKKKFAIEHTKYFLEKYDTGYLDFFNIHKKKDDLSDSYLQGLYYISQLNKKK